MLRLVRARHVKPHTYGRKQRNSTHTHCANDISIVWGGTLCMPLRFVLRFSAWCDVYIMRAHTHTHTHASDHQQHTADTLRACVYNLRNQYVICGQHGINSCGVWLRLTDDVLGFRIDSQTYSLFMDYTYAPTREHQKYNIHIRVHCDVWKFNGGGVVILKMSIL